MDQAPLDQAPVSRWEMLRAFRLVLVLAACYFSWAGMLAASASVDMFTGSLVGEIGAVSLLLLIAIGLWERMTRIKAGIPPQRFWTSP